jgi:AcrR family transcriptional regulator
MARAAKKPYASPLRQAQAQSTRLLVLDAARRLFAERGYVATSVDEIARVAGVGRATVFASVGGKPVLLKQAYDVGIVGDDEKVSLVERPRSRAILAESDPWTLLARYAELVTDISGRIAGIYEAVRQASGADEEARALWVDILRQRRAGMDNLIRQLLANSPLRDGLDPTAAADLAWVLVDPWHYHMLVQQRGWTAARFQAWLTEILQSQLLPPRSGQRRPNRRRRTA